jgi:hypothetical protein
MIYYITYTDATGMSHCNKGTEQELDLWLPTVAPGWGYPIWWEDVRGMDSVGFIGDEGYESLEIHPAGDA